MNEQLRKGQKLIGKVSLKLNDLGFEPTPTNIENYIWNMNSTEFDEIVSQILEDQNQQEQEQSLISYDIDIDLKIINTIVISQNETTSMVQLRYNACGTTHKLENHISNLVKWGLVEDKKPDKNGMPRKISLKQDYGDCMSILIKLKEAIDTVNEYL